MWKSSNKFRPLVIEFTVNLYCAICGMVHGSVYSVMCADDDGNGGSGGGGGDGIVLYVGK